MQQHLHGTGLLTVLPTEIARSLRPTLHPVVNNYMNKIGSMGAGCLCGGVLALFFIWVFEIQSTETVAVIISCAVLGAVASLLLTTNAFLRAFEFVLRIINPP